MKLKDPEPYLNYIDIGEIEKAWKEVFNIPNDRWKSIEDDLKLLKASRFPMTSKWFIFNNLPVRVYEFIIELKRMKCKT